MTLRIGTRGSDLALWQARHVAGLLGVPTEIVIIKTRGDHIQDVPLSGVEGKAFFTAEIEQALIDNRVDLAVHSFKDLPTEGPKELTVAAVFGRENAAECLLIAPQAHAPDALFLPVKRGAKVGTSAPRRSAQLQALRPDLQVEFLRGNVPTRVNRLREGRYDAVLIARAGLARLGLDLSGLVDITLPQDLLVASPGQGALAVQVRAADTAAIKLCRDRLHDPGCDAIVAAERSLLTQAGGGCSLPLGVSIAKSETGYRGLAFLGAGHPTPEAPSRWAAAQGATAAEAANRLWEGLRTSQPTGCGPLAGTAVVLIGSDSAESSLAARISALGGTARLAPVLRFESVEATDLALRLASLKAGDLLVITSRETARRLAGLRAPVDVRVAAVGNSTARVLTDAGFPVHVVGSGDARSLAQDLEVRPGCRVLFPCAEGAGADLPATLMAKGADVERITLYRTRLAEGPLAPPAAGEVRVYGSPSAVKAAEALGWEPSGEVQRVAMGETTAAALDKSNLKHRRTGGSGPDAVIAALFELSRQKDCR